MKPARWAAIGIVEEGVRTAYHNSIEAVLMVAVYKGCFVFLGGENPYVSAIHSTGNEGNSSNVFELASSSLGIGGKWNELIF